MTSGPRRLGEPAPNRIHRLLRRTLAGLLLALPAAALAQGNGRISGVVTDPTGALMPGVKVVVTQVGTRETTALVTGADGGFVFPSLRPATYDLSVSSEGFAPYTQKGIVLRADQAISVDVGLQVGGATESVSVEAAATQVNVTSSTLSQVVEEERIVNLPLNGRNAAALTTLVSGVVVAPTAQADQGYTKTFPVVVMVSANGSRAGQTNYMLDGGNNVDEYTNVNAPFPFPDALQEFSVQTSNYNAEYGQNAGGVVNIVTKGGTEAFHGTVFEYNRNKSLNAAPYFSPDKVKDPLKRNQFGGTLGGPLKGVPRAFFFVGYQRTMIRNQPINDSAAYVPTQAQRNGVFNVANAAQCIRNPFTGAAYPCTATATGAGVSTVDPSHFNRSALALLQYLPAGDAAGTVFFRKPTRENLDEAVVRLDKEIGSRDRVTVRYFYDRFHHDGVLDTSNLLTYADQATVEYQNVLLTETHVFSDRFLNTVSFGYQQNNASRGPLEGGINVADLGVSIWQPAFKQINQIQVSPGFTIGDNPAATFDRSNFTFKDDLNLVRGSHSFGFGVHAQLSTVQIVNQFRQPGAFTFNANESNNAMASFLLGYVANFQQASGQFFDNRGRFVGVYAQDTWQVTRRLTLNLGLRYEPFLPWQETEDRMGTFSPEAYAAGRRSTTYPNAPIGLLFPGDQGMLRDGIRAVYSGVMPRVGFAWDATGDGKTSLRGGVGVFYDTRLSSVFNNIYSNSSPFITQVSVNKPAGGFSDPYAGMTNPFPAQQPPPATTAFPTQSYLTFSPYNEFEVPRSYGWNLIAERQLTGRALARLAYVGSLGRHLWVPVELNPTRYDATTGGTLARPYAPTYTQPITAAEYSGESSYHSLQASAEVRLRRNFVVLANYTWSKALDNLPPGASATAVASGVSYVLPTYEADYTRLDYGPSDFDHRHVFSLSYVWQLPKMQSGPAALRYLVNGWQTSGIVQARSGGPLTIFSGSNNNSRSAQNRDRAVLTGADPYGAGACSGVTSKCKEYLNPAAFAVNPVGTYGTVQKGYLTGPGYFNWDVNLVREIPFSSRVKAELRLEYFNVLNHTNFNDPATTTGSSLGRITGAGDPRIGQISVKLIF